LALASFRLILPVVGAIVIGGGAVWYSRHIP
jgi:hypothetical protein